jgi:hypothetical protein
MSQQNHVDEQHSRAIGSTYVVNRAEDRCDAVKTEVDGEPAARDRSFGRNCAPCRAGS